MSGNELITQMAAYARRRDRIRHCFPTGDDGSFKTSAIVPIDGGVSAFERSASVVPPPSPSWTSGLSKKMPGTCTLSRLVVRPPTGVVHPGQPGIGWNWAGLFAFHLPRRVQSLPSARTHPTGPPAVRLFPKLMRVASDLIFRIPSHGSCLSVRPFEQPSGQPFLASAPPVHLHSSLVLLNPTHDLITYTARRKQFQLIPQCRGILRQLLLQC
jgi:hypothetical protein